MPRLKWADDTSYSKGERGTVEPRTWRAAVDGAKVSVTKHIHYGDEWLLYVPTIRANRHIQLGTSDADEAKQLGAQKAADMLTAKANRMLKAASFLAGDDDE